MNEAARELFYKKEPGVFRERAAIIRIYASEEAKVLLVVGPAVETIKKLGNLDFFADVVVWSAQGYVQESDCGRTVAELDHALQKEFTHVDAHAQIHEVRYGDLYCTALNTVLVDHVGRGAASSLIVSPNVRDLLTPENVGGLEDALQGSALVAGLAFGELREGVLRGLIANTFSLWRPADLLAFGGFGPFSAAPTQLQYAADRSEPKWVGGVEEIEPLIRMGRALQKPFIAPVLPHPGSDEQYKNVLDSVRQATKMASKRARQERAAAAAGGTLEEVKSWVLPNSPFQA